MEETQMLMVNGGTDERWYMDNTTKWLVTSQVKHNTLPSQIGWKGDWRWLPLEPVPIVRISRILFRLT